jgi:hypothetical protein
VLAAVGGDYRDAGFDRRLINAAGGIAQLARHARLATPARIQMIPPRPIGVRLANPPGLTAGWARHGVKSFGPGATAAPAAVSEIARLRFRARSLRELRAHTR